VKALVPEGSQIALPAPPRSPEVLDVAVHAKPPPQDLLRVWDFDSDPPGGLPQGFSALSLGERTAGAWQVQTDPAAPSLPNVLGHRSSCSAPGCFELLVTDIAGFEFPDATVQMRFDDAPGQGEAGIALMAREGEDFFAVMVGGDPGTVTLYRVVQGQAAVVGHAPITGDPRAWQGLRVQRSNFAHVSKPRLEVFVNGREALVVADEILPEVGRIGLVAHGQATVRFDKFRVLKLVTNQPLSAPAAY